MRRSLFLLAAMACGPAATAVHDPDRGEHFFDVPWPDPARMSDAGRPDLAGYPEPEIGLTARVIDGWARRLEQTALGFGNNTGAYFRFDAPLDLPDVLPGEPSDPVLWIDLDTGELAPLDLRFVEDPKGDPFYAPNTLAVIPRLGHAPRSGATVAVVVLRRAGAAPADGVEPDPRVTTALQDLGIRPRVAASTVFTVQDAAGQLQALIDDLATQPGQPAAPTFRRVERLRYAQGQTASGEPATVMEAFFDDGTVGRTELAAEEGDESFEVDLLDPDYPAVVYEGSLQTWNYQGLEGRPYMRPGIQHTQDTTRDDGWIDFDASGLVSTPEPESLRVVVAVPRAAESAPLTADRVLVYDHGTSGHAYNFVQRRNVADDGQALLQAFMDEGMIVVGRDAPLYGQRFPLIDEGHSGGSLGFYNVVNLPAFRDNQRQTALEAHVVQRWVREGADGLPDGIGVSDQVRIFRHGHSLGSVTTALSLARAPGVERPDTPAMLTGSGGVFSHYFLDTGLIDNAIDEETIGLIYGLFGADVPEQVTPASALGAALGLPEAAWEGIDRQHPALHLFQWTMDPSDPMAVGAEITDPVRLVIAEGDWQTPDFTAEAFAERLPQGSAVWCEAQGDYDPHSCMWREDEGPDIVREWLGDR